MAILTTLLAQTGGGLLGWAVSQSCGAGVRSAHNTLMTRLRAGKLDPNHDIERAILRAHYRALEFLVREAVKTQGFDDRAAGVLNGRIFLRKRLQDVEKNKITTLAGYLSADWKGLIPATFEGKDTSLPKSHVDAAIAELLAAGGWDEKEKQTLRTLAHNKDKGWVTAFSSHIREQLKTNQPFRAIYTAQVLDNQTDKLDQILAALPILDEIRQGIDKIEKQTNKNFVAINRNSDELVNIRKDNKQIIEMLMLNIKTPKGFVAITKLRVVIKKFSTYKRLSTDSVIKQLERLIEES